MTDRDRQAASHKRGLNMIWTAAEKYDFQPEFTAFIDVIVKNSVSTFATAHDRSLKNGAISSRIFTCTPE